MSPWLAGGAGSVDVTAMLASEAMRETCGFPHAAAANVQARGPHSSSFSFNLSRCLSPKLHEIT